MNHKASIPTLAAGFALVAAAALTTLDASARAAATDETQAMYGNTPSRNMTSSETGLPDDWDLESGKNILWRQKLGSQSYAGPVVHGDRVYAGTNNEAPRRPGIEGDKGVLMAFRASDGEFLWQATHDKLPAGRVNDWPLQGVCSTPFIEGDTVYYVTNRATVVAADVHGFANGNQGMQDEQHKGEQDADILWEFDMIGELDVFPHNLAAGSPLVIGDLLYTVTGNGVDEGHVNIPSPAAPSFIALDKNTGKLVWESALPGDAILHGTWSNPSYGVVGNTPQVAFPGGDGWIYSFEPKTGHLLWKFDLNPKDSLWRLGGAGTRNNVISTPVFHNGRFYLGVGQDPEHGEGIGHLYALDASKEGDVTGAAQVWHIGNQDFNRTISTAAIHDGIVYISDLSGFLYAFDAETGEKYWTHDTFAAIWGSPFVADGKVYLGDEDGDIVILRAGKKLEVIREVNMGSAVYTTPVAADGVLYVVTRSELVAISTK
ncbi:MAG TPA: PQQ-binding-like beta-propeller repeat protein [Thermoanaerobaculia bacterium]|nr:PQQ-binding-like beta-propeller repeat protein [Thermoanaerobaculia bacterium]